MVVTVALCSAGAVALDVHGDEAEAHELSVPSLRTPEVRVPALQTPIGATPQISVPSISTPQVSVPVPTPEAPIPTPSVSVPPLRAPTVTVPSLRTPVGSTPSIQIQPDSPSGPVSIQAPSTGTDAPSPQPQAPSSGVRRRTARGPGAGETGQAGNGSTSPTGGGSTTPAGGGSISFRHEPQSGRGIARRLDVSPERELSVEEPSLRRLAACCAGGFALARAAGLPVRFGGYASLPVGDSQPPDRGGALGASGSSPAAVPVIDVPAGEGDAPDTLVLLALALLGPLAIALLAGRRRRAA